MSAHVLVQLIDGEFVQSDAEEWRAECEAREVLSWPLEKRRAFLEGVEQKRGKAGTDYLRAMMTRVHAKARARKVLKEEVA